MMTITEAKQETKRLLVEDDNRYFPGIILLLIPMLILSVPVGFIMKGGLIYISISTISMIILTFLSCWFMYGVANLIINKKSLVGSIPNVSIFIPYIIISIIGFIVNDLINSTNNHSSIRYSLILYIVVLVVGILFNIFMQLLVIDGVKNNGVVNYGRVFSIFLKAIPRIIWLNITFIPLYILISITFGILFFWKMTYLQACCVLVLTNIYEENIA